MSEEPSTSPARPRSSPIALGSRAPGPDLARGLLLLFIAVANAHTFLHPAGVTTIRAMPIAGSTVDGVVAMLSTMFVDGRSYTMFAALFGYGMVQVLRRQERAGLDWVATRRLLRRRSRWLVVLGFLHAVLLFAGDVLLAYGLVGLVLVPALRSSDRRLLVYAGLWGLLGAGWYAYLSTPVPPGGWELMFAGDDPLTGMAVRAAVVAGLGPGQAVASAGAFLIGVWAARRRLLEEPELHRPLLRRVVALGILVAATGGLPLAVLVSGLVDVPPAAVAVPFGALHAVTGLAGGPAYAALVALWAVRLRDRPNPVATAIQATGQRSLTCYLAQSVVWHVAFAPYLLDLAHELTLWQSAVLAVLTWVATVLLADRMRRSGRRGPGEVLLRRLVYR